MGRFTEPRKGMSVLLTALRQVAPKWPELQLLVVGRGDAEHLLREAGPELANRIVLLGQADDATKARALRSLDIYCAPNTGGESFGIILAEAMAAGATVVASDLNAFRRVLDDGRAGVLFPVHDDAALASAIDGLLADADRRRELAEAGRRAVAAYDWSVVAGQVLMVYETAIAATPGRVHEVTG